MLKDCFLICRFIFLVFISFISFTSHSYSQNYTQEGYQGNFNIWLQKFKIQAAQEGITEQTIAAALQNISPIQRVIELDRKQPEGSFTFAQYLKRVINQTRIDQGRKLYKKHNEELQNIAKHYGVPAKYIVALWGLETSYGSNTGGFNIIPALATLGHDGRRSSFFTKELIHALKILDEGHIKHSQMKGSWAGAMGQNQFMPSSFHSYAVDGNNDGKKDIWTTKSDVFASSANYLNIHGWKDDEKWGREVINAHNIPAQYIGLKHSKTLKEWSQMGLLQKQNKTPIPALENMKASLIMPDGAGGRSFLVYDNFKVIMKWNKSTYFATSVGLLADLIGQ